jgi:hypothetical protein
MEPSNLAGVWVLARRHISRLWGRLLVGLPGGVLIIASILCRPTILLLTDGALPMIKHGLHPWGQ